MIGFASANAALKSNASRSACSIMRMRAAGDISSRGPEPRQNSANLSIASSTDPFQRSCETSCASAAKRSCSRRSAVAHQQRRQHRLDQRQAANACCVRRVGRDLERDGAAIGMADQMDRACGFRQMPRSGFRPPAPASSAGRAARIAAIAARSGAITCTSGPSAAASFDHCRPGPSEQCSATTHVRSACCTRKAS